MYPNKKQRNERERIIEMELSALQKQWTDIESAVKDLEDEQQILYSIDALESRRKVQK
jgi:hypothetical protein